MPQVISAGVLLFHKSPQLEVFLTHPGGPYFKNKDSGSWFIPKGEVNPGEKLLEAAQRELHEETGLSAQEPFYELGNVKLKSGKIVTIWASETKHKPSFIKSNNFEMEWPPHSGRMQSFPEADNGVFFTIEEAHKKIHASQQEFLVRLEQLLKHSSGEHPEKYNRATESYTVNPQAKLTQFSNNKKL
jgi:predicted NUDIX family NTP pyrophosphohydrolase